MSDPVTPAAPDATPPAPSAPASAAAPASPAAPVAPQPTRVNPWALRPAKASPVPTDAPPSPAPVNAAPVTDPRVDALMALVADTVTQDLAAESESVRKAVVAIAPNDPAAQRQALNILRANGIAGSARGTVPLPASTAPGGAQPAPQPAPASSAAADAAIAAQYAKLQTAAPIRALLFRQQNAEALARHAKTLAS